MSSFHYIGKKTAYVGFDKLSDSDLNDLTSVVNLPERKALDTVLFLHPISLKKGIFENRKWVEGK